MGIVNNKHYKEDTYDLFCINTNNQITAPEYSFVNKIIKEYYYLKDIISSDKINELRSSYNLNTRQSLPINQQNAKNQLKKLREWIKILQSNLVFPRRKKKEMTYQTKTQIQIDKKRDNPVPPRMKFSFGTKETLNQNNVHHSSLQQMPDNMIGDYLDKDNELYIDEYSDVVIYNNIFIENAIVNWKQLNEKDFKQKIIEGIPKGLIMSCWIALNKIPQTRSDEIYHHFSNLDIDDETKAAIRRDIKRTFPKSEYSTSDINYKDHLYNVLKSFAALDTSIGYCQGMNFVIGFLLLMTDFNEKETFYLLIALFSETFKENQYSVRGFFTEGFPLLLYYKYLFSKAFEETMPKLFKHFSTLDIPLDVWVNKWIQTLFTIILPLNWCCRVWDCVFIFGTHFLIKFSIVLTQIIEKDLLDLNEERTVLKYLNGIQQYPLSADCENLSQKCSIDSLIQKAIKVNIMSSFIKEKYIKEEEIDFDTFLKSNRKKYNISLSLPLSPVSNTNSFNNKSSNCKEYDSSSIENSQLIINTDLDQIENNGMKKKTLTRSKYKTQIIFENEHENYDEDMDEESDNVLSTEIDLRKSVNCTSNKIVKNLEKYQHDFCILKSKLDNNYIDINQKKHRKQNSHNMLNYKTKKRMLNNNDNDDNNHNDDNNK